MAKRGKKGNGKAVVQPILNELTFKAEIVSLDDLKPHPRNYRGHPDDQIAELVESLKEHGVYRNVVCARDGTLLAGHGVVQAARAAGIKKIPVIRLDVGPNEPSALRVLVGDNEIEHLADQADRMLSELLKEIKEADEQGLKGTGYDEAMLANFLMVTRPKSEIEDFDAAAQWVGMPDYDSGEQAIKLVVLFANEEAMKDFARKLKINVHPKSRTTWYPQRKRDDVKNLMFEG
jgi:hypothetical protein